MPIVHMEEENGRKRWVWKEYIGDAIAQNLLEQKNPQKSKEGAFGRKIASIPITVYRQWQKEFDQTGARTDGGKWGNDWKKFLRKKISENPQFRTVDKLLHITPNPGHTIIK